VRKQSVTRLDPRENLQVLNALNLLVVGSIPTRPTIPSRKTCQAISFKQESLKLCVNSA
jgi:hypothetical protein